MEHFKNTETAFSYRTNKQLKLANFLFTAMKSPLLTQIGNTVLGLSIKANLPINGLVKKTIFAHFCGGETLEESKKVVDVLKAKGVMCVMDYSVEGKNSEAAFDHVLKETLNLIDFVSEKELPFVVFKPTGVGRFALFQKITEKETLTSEEQKEWTKVVDRFDQICKKAISKNILVMIDAEETWMQEAADDLCIDLMKKYNKEKVVVYNTLQMYRHDRLAYLKKVHAQAKEENFKLGFKIVRGAYMEKERERASEKGYPSPIQPNKEASDRDYDAAITYIIENNQEIGLYAGTHNEKSAALFMDLIKEKGLDSQSPKLWLGQLYAMSDHISLNAAKLGYNVSKYLPYGPVKEVIPYLIRRAAENTSVAGQTGRELALIAEEVKRRNL